MNDTKIKQQVVEKIQTSTNILVTVSNNPSVDALSAALGLTLMLNKMGKHATAVFSGAIPPAITFLDPQKTFEATTDSLRDFIIALDKEKADHLRYKVDGDMVKIFITPYRTTITSDDLNFSQGDYNVELVLALGVDNQGHLDSALEAHGRILHDATVVTLSAGQQSSSLGSLDWRDESASSLSEMLASLAEPLLPDKDQPPLLDQQIATALLTGIVAETDRFSNTKTSSKVMTIAAQLMADGADQQLIASRLEESHTIDKPAIASLPPSTNAYAPSDAIEITHAGTTPVAETPSVTPVEPPAIQAAPVAPAAPITLSNAYALDPEPTAASAPAPIVAPMPEPTATDPEPQSPHAYMSETPMYSNTPSSDAAQPITNPAEASMVGGTSELSNAYAPDPAIDPIVSEPAPAVAVISDPAYPEEGSRDDASRDDALAAVHATYDEPAPVSSPVTLPQPPPLPDFSTLPPPPPSPYDLPPLEAPVLPEATTAPAAPERLGDIFAPEPAPPLATEPVASSDPAQFKIPGQ